mmetsp:Transcript_9309/g.26622  ORF Transcript_9309/g.26622 Transcript_9309/m.26622 type:complete len:324 (+) Transcript_9309:14-985(+)
MAVEGGGGGGSVPPLAPPRPSIPFVLLNLFKPQSSRTSQEACARGVGAGRGVGLGWHRDKGLLRKHVLEALLDELVSTADELKPIDVVELGRDLAAKQPACSSGADVPSLDVFGVGPHEVTERPFVGNLLDPLNSTNLVQGPDIRRQSAVHAQHPPIDECAKREVVKHLDTVAPGVCVAILSLALIIEAVHLCDLTALMVPSQKSDACRVAGLQEHQHCEDLQTVVSTVYKVPHEYVVCLRDLPARLEQAQQVMELPVDITAHRDWAVDRLDVGLLHQYLFHEVAQLLELILGQVFARLDLLYTPVQIQIHRGWKHGETLRCR